MSVLLFKFLRSRRGWSSKPKGFTLTELIVVITILSILSVIGFTVMSHQSSVARDGKRISDIKTLSESARITSAQLRKLPTPIADSISLTVSGSFIGYQGFMSLALVNPLGYGSDKIFDPKDNIPYTYRVNQHYDQAQFLAYLENPRFERTIEIAKQSLPSTLPSNLSDTLFASDSLFSSDSFFTSDSLLVSKAYALDTSSIDLSKRYPYSAGDRLGIFLSKGSKQPLQNGVSGTGSRDISLSDVSTLDIIVGSQGADEYVSTDISTGSLNALKDGSFDEKALLGMNSGTGSGGNSSGSVNNDLGGMGNRISVGVNHSCLLKTDGTVVCWGSDDDMIFGSGPGQATPPSGLANVSEVSVWYNYSMARTSNGHVSVWGGNTASYISQYTSITDATSISAGAVGCIVHSNGTVTCYDADPFGSMNPPVGLSDAIQVSVGYLAACAVRSYGTVVCWGNNGAGQLDIPDGLSGVSQISLGVAHACALKMNGTVVCWGDPGALSASMNLGQTTVPDNLTNATYISAGYTTTCAVKSDGTVVCWGVFEGGASAQPPSGTTGVTQISVGYAHICALQDGNNGICWGDNSAGQATWSSESNNVAAPPLTPTGLNARAGDQKVTLNWESSSGATKYTLAWSTSETGSYTEINNITGNSYIHLNRANSTTYFYKVKAVNAAGQSAYSSLVSAKPPFDIIEMKSLASYGSFHCAINQSGSLSCWNDYSHGISVGVPTNVPSNLFDSTDLVDVQMNLNTACVLHSSGTVDCWGGLHDSTDIINVPIGITSAVDLVMGEQIACVRNSDDTVNCWGDQYSLKYSPFPPANLANVKKISLSGGNGTWQNLCALKYDTTVDCWGYMYYNDPYGSIVQGHYSTGGFIDIFSSPNGLAYGITTSNEFQTIYMPYGPVETWNDVVAVKSESAQICLSRSNGVVQCKGHVNGNSNTGLWINVFSDANNIQDELWLGLNGGCSKGSDDMVNCWGTNPPSMNQSVVADGDLNLIFSQNHTYSCGKVGLADTASRINCWGWFSY